MRDRRLLRRMRPGVLLDMTPMVDVVFNLLIFFMVSTTFITINQAMPVDLPQATTALPQAGSLPTVTVTSEENIFVGSLQVSESDLVAALTAEMESLGQTVVVFRADQSIRHGLSVRVMDLMMTAGASRIAISTGN